MDIPARLRRQVARRADSYCEYCGLSQAGQEAAFHIDHVVPLSAGGKTTLSNLALACVSCSLRKGARLSAIDSQTGRETPLFNPRKNMWRLHFRWNGVRAVGIDPIGRTTVDVLKMNRDVALAIRQEEAARGRHPPPKHH